MISVVLLSDSIQEKRKAVSASCIATVNAKKETEFALNKVKSTDIESNRQMLYPKSGNIAIPRKEEPPPGARMVKSQYSPPTITHTQQPTTERTMEAVNRSVAVNGHDGSKQMLGAKAHVTKDCLERWKRGMAKYLGLGNRPPGAFAELCNFIGASCPSRKDGWGNSLRYETDGQKWTIASSGEDGKFETDDDIVVFGP